jgi:hypothetical protein
MTVFPFPSVLARDLLQRRSESGEPQELERAVALAAIRQDPNFASAVPPTSLGLSWSFNIDISPRWYL